MDLFNALKSFFGLSTHKPDQKRNDLWIRDEWKRNDDDSFDDFHNQIFKQFSFGNDDINDIFKEFDSLFSNMSNLFSGFDDFENFNFNFYNNDIGDERHDIPFMKRLPIGPSIGPSIGSSFGSSFESSNESSNPRELMLKKEGNEDDKTTLSDRRIDLFKRPDFGDYDIDDEISKNGLDVVIKPKDIGGQDAKHIGRQDDSQRTLWKSPGQFFQKSYVYKSQINNDGKIEEHKIVRDGSGFEETTITQKIGDKTYSKTIKKTDKGVVEENQQLINMDENELEDFKRKWNRFF